MHTISQAFQKSLSVYSNYTGTTKCLDVSSAYDEDMGSLGWDFQVKNLLSFGIISIVRFPYCNNESLWNQQIAVLYGDGDANVQQKGQEKYVPA